MATDLNAMTRAIDLMCKIMSPAVAGLIIYFGSLTIGAAVIAAWNFFSVFVEYALLWKVYQIVPELSRKKPRNAGRGDASAGCNMSGAIGFTKPCTVLKLGFMTGAGNKCIR